MSASALRNCSRRASALEIALPRAPERRPWPGAHVPLPCMALAVKEEWKEEEVEEEEEGKKGPWRSSGALDRSPEAAISLSTSWVGSARILAEGGTR